MCYSEQLDHEACGYLIKRHPKQTEAKRRERELEMSDSDATIPD